MTGQAHLAISEHRINPRPRWGHNREAIARDLWENCPAMSAAKIAVELECTKNAVIGVAWRRHWKPRRESPKPPPLKTFERLDLLHQRMDDVMSETESILAAHPALSDGVPHGTGPP